MTKDNLVCLNRNEILNFFDCAPMDSRRHANAIVAIPGEELGVGLMKHYFEHVEACVVEVLPEPCNPGTRSGGRLDRWMLVQWSTRKVMFQVEIKNWSANSLGGRRLKIDATKEEVAAHKRERWSRIWDSETFELRVKETRKVLTRMKPPRQEIVEPVLCMWDAMHPQGDTSPWFNVVVAEGHSFEQLWVFSMSSYLRNMSEDQFFLYMPDTIRRLEWFRHLFTVPGHL